MISSQASSCLRWRSRWVFCSEKIDKCDSRCNDWAPQCSLVSTHGRSLLMEVVRSVGATCETWKCTTSTRSREQALPLVRVATILPPCWWPGQIRSSIVDINVAFTPRKTGKPKLCPKNSVNRCWLRSHSGEISKSCRRCRWAQTLDRMSTRATGLNQRLMTQLCSQMGHQSGTMCKAWSCSTPHVEGEWMSLRLKKMESKQASQDRRLSRATTGEDLASASIKSRKPNGRQMRRPLETRRKETLSSRPPPLTITMQSKRSKTRIFCHCWPLQIGATLRYQLIGHTLRQVAINEFLN